MPHKEHKDQEAQPLEENKEEQQHEESHRERQLVRGQLEVKFLAPLSPPPVPIAS